MLQESNRIELKATLNDKIEKEIVAFLNNHEGGILYIGIDDKGQPVENLDIDYTQLKIADRIKNNILPSTLGLFDIVTEIIDGVAVINAVVHNDFSREIPPVFEIFSDRMEFTSYGGLIQGQSCEDFFSCSSMPRNRELMRVFKDVGLVEQLGSGMSRILKAYDRNIFEISEHFIKVVFPFSKEEEENIATEKEIGDEIGDDNGDEMMILQILEKEPDITAKKK